MEKNSARQAHWARPLHRNCIPYTPAATLLGPICVLLVTFTTLPEDEGAQARGMLASREAPLPGCLDHWLLKKKNSKVFKGGKKSKRREEGNECNPKMSERIGKVAQQLSIQLVHCG